MKTMGRTRIEGLTGRDEEVPVTVAPGGSQDPPLPVGSAVPASSQEDTAAFHDPCRQRPSADQFASAEGVLTSCGELPAITLVITATRTSSVITGVRRSARAWNTRGGATRWIQIDRPAKSAAMPPKLVMITPRTPSPLPEG